jgi:uncharacterized protein (TIGR02246 family)
MFVEERTMTSVRLMGIAGVLVLQAAMALAQSESLDGNSCSDPVAVQAAQRIVNTWKDGYNSGDPARVAALYSADAYYLTQHFATGIVQGRDAIQAYVKRGVDAKYHIDSLRILAVGCNAEMMYVVARYDATNGGQATFGVNLVVLRKEAENWLIVAHEAAVPDPATAVQKLDIPSTPVGKQ